MQNNQLRKNNKGVTLVEVIAVIAVLGVVMADVTGFMITGARMSVQVSNNATVSSREQTAVELINRLLWGAEYDSVIPGAGETVFVDGVGQTVRYYELKIGESILTSMIPVNDTTSQVVLNGTPLCEGEIYFDPITDNTVTYYLNGTPHVVHLRAESPTEQASEQE